MSAPTNLVSITEDEAAILCEAVYVWLEGYSKQCRPMESLGRKLLKRLEALDYEFT